MQQLSWLKSHIGTLEQASEKINKFHWNIEVQKSDQEWVVKGGEKVLLRTDSKDSVDAFLYGMALAYSVLPESMVMQFREDYQP